MTIQEAVKWIGSLCSGSYDEREAAAITNLVMEKITGFDRSTRAMRRAEILSPVQLDKLNRYADELSRSRPVQYVLGEAWFAGWPFYVDERVLIPRPETEELVEWVIQEKVDAATTSLLDIGTGSGCISCSIAKKRPELKVSACDVSEAALEVARRNAGSLGVSVDFFIADLLGPNFGFQAGSPDIVVSNPPYIPAAHRSRLDVHVADFEPALALFVEGEDPLLFYKKIGSWARGLPAPGPVVFLELHHDFARDTAAWFSAEGYKIELRKDYSGNNRMLRAWR